jgi:hypothetical protein
MKKETQPPKGASKSNVTAPATAGTRQQQSSQRRLDASAGSGDVVPMTAPSVAVNARYIDSRMKQFCLR